MNSPVIKEFGDQRITAGERCLVVDLEACTGMDSTFMGTLAGLAARLSTREGATLQVADAGSRNRRSLEDLGLDFMMEIDPPEAGWRDQMAAIRAQLGAPQKSVPPGQLQRAMHVLEAHQILADANDKNAKTFSNVVSMLEDELEEKRKLSPSPKK